MTLADYDGVTYHCTTPYDQKSIVRISMKMRCYHQLRECGALEVLAREFGDSLLPDADTEQGGWDVSVCVDLAAIEQAQWVETAQKLASLKTLTMGAAFERAFEQQLSGKLTPKQDGELMQLSYRDEEGIFVRASHDRVTVVFSTLFKDDTDKVFGKVFLQEFVDCRKLPNLQNSPQALYTAREPPMELRGVVKEQENVGYVTFVLNPRHYQTPAQRTNTIALIQYFRNYLHYHIKCSKAYMHSRMRAKVDQFLKVLNRAKPEVE